VGVAKRPRELRTPSPHPYALRSQDPALDYDEEPVGMDYEEVASPTLMKKSRESYR
jgi:hypothetical protein